MAPRPSLDRNNSVRILYGFVVSRSFEDQANQENSNGVPGHPLLQSCSGMLVQDPSKGNDVDALFDQARQAGGVEGHGDHLQPSSSSRSFSGTARRLTGETITTAPSHPETVTHTITFWTNGFTIDDGPLRRIDDPENASFLESIRKSECPQELAPADRRTVVHVNLVKKEQECPVTSRDNCSKQFAECPTTSNGLSCGSGTTSGWHMVHGCRMVSRFNFHHTVRDIRGFIDASRPAAPRSYHHHVFGRNLWLVVLNCTTIVKPILWKKSRADALLQEILPA
ncbi:hypothetical protein DCAR_0101629 [Daucus carota subsp. sativus]|uniref:SEP domain-containing protein n=1 Tax=Daucus carota subsp. sativus TaxID=79200 RepID=A0AAF0W6C7_DAUCS|nr:hypothetical protein DCAR_0101629 [Daucus carota subsp. sativus]